MMTLTNLYLTLALIWVPLSLFAHVSHKYLLWSPRLLLKMNYFVLGATGLLVVFINQLRQYQMPPLNVDLERVPALLESSSTLQTVTAAANAYVISRLPVFSWWSFVQISVGILVALGVFGVLRGSIGIIWNLRRAFVYKNIGRVRIYLVDPLASPFTLTLGRQHIVVLPQWSMASWQQRELYLKHELQHIRQGDTRMAYLVTALQWMFFWHPFFWLWKTKVEQIQEISCDCFLIGHKKISFRDYTNCLLETHRKARLADARAPLGVTLAFWRHKKQLLWRVKFMNEYQTKKQRHFWGLAVSVPLLVCCMIGTAYASKSFHRRGVDKTFVTSTLEALILGQSRVPTEYEVMKTLSEIMSSPKQRKFYRDSLERLKSVDRIIDTEMLQYGVPRELKAMALVESGFQNLPPQRGIFERSTGMWQIIARTGQVLGLNVSAAADERMDIGKATNAAIRYIVMNRARFDNWDLSVLSYNAGENAVAEAIKKAGSKDPMEVRKYLPEETQNYYIKVLAAAIIMSNPSLVEE